MHRDILQRQTDCVFVIWDLNPAAIQECVETARPGHLDNSIGPFYTTWSEMPVI